MYQPIATVSSPLRSYIREVKYATHPVVTKYSTTKGTRITWIRLQSQATIWKCWAFVGGLNPKVEISRESDYLVSGRRKTLSAKLRRTETIK